MSHRSTTRTVHTADGVVVGVAHRPFFPDLYHRFLVASWWAALGGIVGAFLVANAIFACAFGLAGGVDGVHSALDAYAFSVQTMATIGYGGMSPRTPVAHIVVIGESVFGLLFTALSTGLVFAKFTRTPASIRFATSTVISRMNGLPTLLFRVGNERDGLVVDVHARLILFRTETTQEGVAWYRQIAVPLDKEWTPALTRSWNLMHTITEQSPLFGLDAAELARLEVEFVLSLTGLDQTTMQPVHAMQRYTDGQVKFGTRFADMVAIQADGKYVLDMARFDDVVGVE